MTAPQEPEKVCAQCGVRRAFHAELSPECVFLDVGVQVAETAESKLAALTHAIEALRGEMEQKATREENDNWCNTADAPIWRAIHRGRAEVYRELAAILKEWEGRHA